jgi:hypothetical protein
MMSYFPIKDIKERDTVMVEANIRRYKVKTPSGKGQWHSWRAYLDLKAISIVHQAPSIFHPAEDSSDDELRI